MPELIRGNRDGAHGTSATYTICRLFVPRQQLVEEIDVHNLHPDYRVYHRRNAKGDVIDEWLQNKPNGLAADNINHGNWPACCPAMQQLANAGRDVLQKKRKGCGDQGVEYIHGHRDGKSRRNENYTVCRIGVPVETVEREVRAGLHPDYTTVRVAGATKVQRKGSTQPDWC